MKNEEMSTKERLLRCGEAEFLQWGYQKASLRRISAAAGVTTGAFYFQFAGKGALFSALVGDAADQAQALVHGLRAKDFQSVAARHRCAARIADFLWPRRTQMTLLLRAAEGTAHADLAQSLRRQLATLFRPAPPAGPSEDALPDLLAHLCLVACEDALSAASLPQMRAWMTEIVEFFCRGIHG